MEAIKIGNFTVTEIVENDMRGDPTSLFPDATHEEVDEVRALLPHGLFDDEGKSIMTFRSYLIRTGRHNILVDTCWGNDKNRPKSQNAHMLRTNYLQDLQDAGAPSGSIDFVFCTHMHVDHVGWNTRLENGKWVPTFPNAKHLFVQREWDFWGQKKGDEWGADVIEDSVRPVVDAGLAVFIDDDHHLDIEEGAWVEPLPGHTPGHSGLHVKSNGQEAVFIGDMMHSSLQVPRPDWNMRVCLDQAQSRATRRQFLERYCDTSVRVLPQHFGVAAGGFIAEKAGTFVFKV